MEPLDLAGVIGTFLAVAAALAIAVWTETRQHRERRAAAMAQARLVVVTAANGALRFLNYSSRPVLDVHVTGISDVEGGWVPNAAMVGAGGNHRLILLPGGDSWDLYITTRDGERVRDWTAHSATYRWTDADGTVWERTDQGTPRRGVERSYRRLLDVMRSKFSG